MEIKPIGSFSSQKKYTYELSRQPALDSTQEVACITLNENQNFEQALIGLESFSHIWLIFLFHQNQNWKPMVQPPRGSNKKLGVFATRAPYRPNPIGMSVVKLVKIEGRKIWIQGHDLLDETPILDIKPYIPYSDSIAEANSGWLERIEKFNIEISSLAEKQIEFLESQCILGLKSFIYAQLEYEPTNSKIKRVQALTDDQYCIAYRTWRIHFELKNKSIQILKIRSAYTQEEISSSEDPYQDKEVHRLFQHLEP